MRAGAVYSFGHGASAALLAGRRLHLQQGPINLVIKVYGAAPVVEHAYRHACQRFDGLLEGLAAELDQLRQPVQPTTGALTSPTARRMQAATAPYYAEFITPMAAVAGAVADEILDAMRAAPHLEKIFINNGGDIALWLAPGQELAVGVVPSLRKAVPQAKLVLRSTDAVGGIATSGWDGHSHSLGIADAVTVLAGCAAAADAAATLIANKVDVDHPAIERRAACELDPDSDLGERPVTTAVGALPCDAVARALTKGAAYAAELFAAGHIRGALLALQNDWRIVGAAKDDRSALKLYEYNKNFQSTQGAKLTED